MLSRRSFLLGGAAGASLAFAPGAISREPISRDTLPRTAPIRRLALSAREIEAPLLGPGAALTRHACAYDGMPALTLRAPVGTRLMVDFKNELKDPTTVHWHGIRVPYLSDGVAPITQKVIPPGGTFTYDVPLPDPGFYFFHPHCDETGQVGRGLVGLLLVEDPRDPHFDLDHIVAVKDFRLGADGQFIAMSTDEGAANAGTFGTVRGVNERAVTVPSDAPRVAAPAFGDVRLRVIVADSTRVIDLGLDTEEAAIIAVDGQALAPRALDDLANGVWRMGPAMRLDLHVRMPAAGGEVKIYDYRSAEPFLLTTLVAQDSPQRKARTKSPFKPKALPPAAVPRADIKSARRLDYLLQTAAGPTVLAPGAASGLSPDDPLAKALVESLCVGGRTFWAISRNSWATGEALRLPPPLALLEEGTSYVFSIANLTKHPHPMHLHGHVFEVLSSTRKGAPTRYLADTVMTDPNETVEIAFKATSGNWVFHCHILEHMDTGLMGWFQVV